MRGGRSVLLLCNPDRRQAANVREHIEALRGSSNHSVQLFNPLGERRPLALELEQFDAIAIHYTVITIAEAYLPAWLSDRIARFGGLKIQLIQDEYRWVDAITSKIRELGIDVVYTLVPQFEVAKIYGDRTPETETVTTLAGFVSDALLRRPVPSLRERTLDVGYRGRTVPFWLGRLGQEKIEIGRRFLARAGATGLRCDIAWGENDRLYGAAWNAFLASCRATLGSESGASIVDYDGSVEEAVRGFLAEHPAATFGEVEGGVLAPYEGNLDLRVISPRQFEAAALRTALVLFPGSYSGLLEPWRHFIPLERDFSNFDEVVERLRDVPALEELVARTYEEVACDPRNSLAAFVDEFDALIEARTPERARGARTRVPRKSLTRTVGRRVEDGIYAGARTAVALAFVARHPALRRLARAYAADSEARREIGPSAVLDDLLKLALLTDAHARSNGRPFTLTPTYDEAGRRLTIGSTTSPSSRAEQVNPETLLEPLRRGELEIVWNHAAVGEYAPVRLPGNRKLQIHVGYHGVSGAHSFRALRRLGTRMPDRVLRALEPVLG